MLLPLCESAKINLTRYARRGWRCQVKLNDQTIARFAVSSRNGLEFGPYD
jgi:hypothetical protein